MGRTQHHPKTEVVVPVVGLIPVAVSTARVVPIVVPGAAAQDLPDRLAGCCHPAAAMIAQKTALRAPGEGSPAPPPEIGDQSIGAQSARDQS